MTKQAPASFAVPDVAYGELLRRSARRNPDKIALRLRDEALTYRELDVASSRLAHALQRLGLRKGDRVVLATYNRIEFVVAFYATVKAGGVASPMNPSYKEREVAHQVGESDARIVFVDGHGGATVARVRASLPALEHVIDIDDAARGDFSLEDLIAAESATEPPEVAIDPAEDLVALPFTSGTTSRPKGVMLTHRNLVCSHLQYTVAGRVMEEDVSLIFVPFCHVYGLMLMGGAIAAGATQVLMERYALDEVLRLVEDEGITLLYANPPVVVEMSGRPDLESFDFSRVKYINSGGAALAEEVCQQVQHRTGTYVVRGYGMTEASLSGNYVPGEERRIIDPETGEVRGVGEPGEVVIRGPHVMRGYWKDEARTAEVLRDGWLHTGDLGVLDEKGRIKILDRKKDLIKYKGFSVSPAELESVLSEHDGVADVAVAGLADPIAGQLPVAFAVPRDGAELVPEELIDFVATRVAGYKKVRRVHIVDEIPRNSNGKILRTALLESLVETPRREGSWSDHPATP